MGKTHNSAELADAAVLTPMQFAEKQHAKALAHHNDINVFRRKLGLPYVRNFMQPTDTSRFTDACRREGYVSKAAMVAELLSSGERLQEYRERTYYQGRFDPDAVAKEEEGMLVYPQARHDYSFDDFYADTDFLHSYFQDARLRAQRERDELNNANREMRESLESIKTDVSPESAQS